MTEPFYRPFDNLTVGELMAMLSRLPLDAPVVIPQEYEQSWMRDRVRLPITTWGVRTKIGIGCVSSRSVRNTDARHLNASAGPSIVYGTDPIDTVMLVRR